MSELTDVIRSVLTEELRSPGYGTHQMSGFCYVVSEAYYHILGGKSAGLTPCTVKHEGVTHWYLKEKTGEIVDITADQFETVPDYSKGRGRGFLTKGPSKRAQVVIDRVQETLCRVKNCLAIFYF